MDRGWVCRLGIVVVGVASLTGIRPAAAGMSTYLSLVDSVAFGDTDFRQDPSFGDRGYVAPFADFLGSRAGGVRPNVLNLALDGETTASFTTGVGRVAPLGSGLTDANMVGFNRNYNGLNPAPTQQQRMIATVGAEAALGHSIDTVTISLGSNDLFALATAPGFATAAPGDQQAMLQNTLTQLGNRYGAIVGEVHALAPGARVLLLGSYNPYPADPSSPFAPLAALAIPGLNSVIAGVAAATNSTYVDIAPAFVGREAALTLMNVPSAGSDNVHPNADGYLAIAARLEAEAAPEPSTWMAAALGALGLVALVRRRPRHGRRAVRCGATPLSPPERAS